MGYLFSYCSRTQGDEKWRNKSFNVFESLQYIYEGQLATGEFATRTGTDGTALKKRKGNVELSGSPSAALHEETSPSKAVPQQTNTNTSYTSDKNVNCCVYLEASKQIEF